MSKFKLKKLSGWLLAGYWIALFVGTHIPLGKLPVPEGSDKVMHFGAYFGLQFLLLLWLALRAPLTRVRWTAAIGMVFVFGIVDEVLQPYVNRHADVNDCIADWCGAILAATLFAVMARKLELSPAPNDSDS